MDTHTHTHTHTHHILVGFSRVALFNFDSGNFDVRDPPI